MPLTPESFLQLGPPKRFEAAAKERQATSPSNIAASNIAIPSSSALSLPARQQAQGSGPNQSFNPRWNVKDQLRLMQLAAELTAGFANKAVPWETLSENFNDGGRRHRSPRALQAEFHGLCASGVNVASLERILGNPRAEAAAMAPRPSDATWKIEDELDLMKIAVTTRAESVALFWNQVSSDSNNAQRHYRTMEELQTKYRRLLQQGERVLSLEERLNNG